MIAQVVPWLLPAALLAAAAHLLWSGLSKGGYRQIKNKWLFWLGVIGMTVGFAVTVNSALHH